MFKKKKAEMTTQQIILLIILIASFIVLVFFLIRLNIGESSEAQLCHDSVLKQGSNIPGLSSTPIQCYRKYICITRDGSCEKINKPKKFKVKTLNETYKILADEMASCWWSFGEGKVAYVAEELSPGNYCSVCSQISFDNSLSKIKGIENNEINKDDFYKYLQENDYSDDQTYLQYIFGTNNLDDLNTIKDASGNKVKLGFGSILVGGEQPYLIVMGITSKLSTWKAVVVGVVAGAILLPVAAGSLGMGVLILGGAAGAGVAGTIVNVAGDKIEEFFNPEIGAITIEGKGIENVFMAPTIQEDKSDKFKSLNCKEILTLN